MASDPTATSYDELPYGDNCFPDTHPDHLAALAALYGLKAPPVDACRALELGCAAGGNLIPMAMDAPGSTFVGLDLSPRQVATGKETAEALGLGNVDLRAADLAAVDASFGRFDYIVCHGVYSWVPEAVRDRILAVCAGNLKPEGLAYVSYNTYPGWHARGIVREMLAYHVRRAPGAGAAERVGRAREFLDEVGGALANPSSAFGVIVRTEAGFLQGVANSYLYHEHLEETNHPLYFHEFAGRAAAHGLTFLAETRTQGLADNLPPAAREAVERWSAGDRLAREQYVDFATNRTFRRSALCLAGREPLPSPTAGPVAGMWVATRVVPASPEPDATSDAPESFRKPDGGGTLTTNNPLLKTALVALHEAWPQAVAFGDLWDRVASRLGKVPEAAGGAEDGPGTLREALLRCFLSDLVDLHVRPPRFASRAGERPLASPLARLQARDADRERVTNLRRRTVELAGLDRMVLTQLDGTRDADGLVEAMVGRVVADEFTISQGDQPIRDPDRLRAIFAAELGPSLERLARLALLVR